MSSRKTSLRTILRLIMGFAVIIAAMTWYDLQPKPARVDTDAPQNILYVAPVIPTADIPEGDTRLVIWIGSLDDQGVFHPDSRPPATFPQRELSIAIDLASVPVALSPAFEAIKKELIRWEAAGNIITDIYIRHETDTPDWQKLNSFISGMRSFQNLSYRVSLMARTKWFSPDSGSKMAVQDIQKSVSFLVFDMNEAATQNGDIQEMINRLDAVEFPFRLIADESLDLKAFDTKYMSKIKFFGGFITALGIKEKTQ